MFDTLKNFNDSLALILVGLIFLVFIIDGTDLITLADSVTGALIFALGTIVIFYFRKSPPKEQ